MCIHVFHLYQIINAIGMLSLMSPLLFFSFLSFVYAEVNQADSLNGFMVMSKRQWGQ